jgi:hypothetical protein
VPVLAWYNVVALMLLSDPAADPVNVGILAQYGVLGVVAAGGIVFARVSYKRETDRSDRLESEVTRLNNLIIERAIPALTSAAQAAEDATRLLRAIQRAQEISVVRSSATSRPDARGDDR